MTNNIPNIPQETINSVLVDILKGAKEAGHEIYGASKTGIVKAVDFAQEQAPLVVQEFLKWKFAQSVIWLTVSIIGLIILGYLIKKCVSKEWLKETQGTSVVGVVFLSGFFVFVLFVNVVPNIEQIVKIKVAPRVFIIEWTSDQINRKQ